MDVSVIMGIVQAVLQVLTLLGIVHVNGKVPPKG